MSYTSENTDQPTLKESDARNTDNSPREEENMEAETTPPAIITQIDTSESSKQPSASGKQDTAPPGAALGGRGGASQHSQFQASASAPQLLRPPNYTQTGVSMPENALRGLQTQRAVARNHMHSGPPIPEITRAPSITATSDARQNNVPPPVSNADQDPSRSFYKGLIHEIMRNGNADTLLFGQTRVPISLMNMVLAYRHLIRAGVPTLADEVWMLGGLTWGEARMRDALAIVPG